MRDALELLLLLSVSGSILGILALLLRKLFHHRVRSSFWYYLWIIVALRFLLPLEAPVVIFSIPTAAPSATTLSQPAVISPEAIPNSPEEKPQPLIEAPLAPFMPSISMILLGLWASVAAIRLLGSVIGTVRFTRLVRSTQKDMSTSPRLQKLASEAAVQVELPVVPEVCVLPGIDIPLQIGLYKPVVLLPEHTCNSGDIPLRHILLHEFVHCKRRDILYKWMVEFFVCVHWFNPLVYWFRHQISTDCELSCDARVLQLLHAQERTSYGDTLLTAASGLGRRHLPAGSVMLSQDAKALKQRLTQIAGYGKRTKPLAVLSIALVTVLLTCGFVAGPSHNQQGRRVVA